MKRCTLQTSNPTPSAGVAAFFGKFNKDGSTADFADHRGMRSKTVVIEFQATGTYAYARNKNFLMQYDEEINNSKILGIEVLGTAQAAQILSPSKDIPQSDFNKGLLIIQDQCNQELMRTPLANLCKSLNGNKLTFTQFQEVDWGNCYITFPGAATISQANAIAFRVYFTPNK